MQTRAALLTLAAGAVALSPSSAAAHERASVSCGLVLTQSVKLTADLTGCTGNGLIIGADGVTVDLNGHTLAGNGTGSFDGVVDEDNHARVTVKNGRIENFGGAVLLPGGAVARDVVVRNVTSTDGVFAAGINGLRLVNNTFGRGISLFEAEHTVLDGNHVRGGGIGFFFPSRDSRITHNTIEDSDGRGILIFGGFGPSRDNLIAHNTIDDTVGESIQLAGDVSNTVVDHNTTTHSEAHAITVNSEIDEDTGATLAPTRNIISNNHISASFGGIETVEADGNQFTRNTIVGAGTFGDPNGPFGRSGYGILAAGGSHNLVSRNTVIGGRGGLPGISIGGSSSASRRTSANVVERNAVIGNEADGIVVGPFSQDTTLEHNTADGNGADGIHVLSPFTTLTRNGADGNAAYGIEALTDPPVTDGGNNRASGNGLGQCIGVACR
jgi:Right handed beta helix region/Periplasmic copper-binding protein (NosD)